MEGSNQQENIELKLIPQLSKLSGVSHDYRNNYVSLKTWLGVKKIEGLRLFIKNKENGIYFPKYEEYFSPSIYKDVVTEKNRKAVEKIDELIDELRDVTSDEKIDNLTEEVFLKIYNAIEFEILRPDLEDHDN